MSVVDDLVEFNTKAELVDQAEDIGLSIKDDSGKPLNKTELAEAIIAAESPDEPEPVEAEPEPVVASSDPVDTKRPYDSKKGEDILVKFTKNSPRFEYCGHVFSGSNPFKVLSEPDARKVFNGAHAEKFRVANPAEAEQFYS